MDSFSLVTGLVMGGPFAVYIGWFVWSHYLSSAARASHRAYRSGFQSGLAGVLTYHDAPFESARLILSWRDGLQDARLYLSDKADREKLARDMEKFARDVEKLARD